MESRSTPVRRHLGLVALGCAGVAFALGAEWVSIRAGVVEDHFWDLMGGLPYFVAGLIAMARVPGNRIGPLMLLAGFTWFSGNYRNLGIPGVTSLLEFPTELHSAVVLHIVLAYPTGRLQTRLERAIVWFVYLWTMVTNLVILLFHNPRAQGCTLCVWTSAPWSRPDVVDAVLRIGDITTLVLTAVVMAALVARYRRATPAERHELQPLWVATLLLAAALVLNRFGSGDGTDDWQYLLWQVRGVLLACVPLIFLYGLLNSSRARSSVGTLMLELNQPVPPGDLESLLAAALSDQSLAVVYAVPGTDRWVDASGNPRALPAESGDRAVTLVEREGQPYAALVHTPGIHDEVLRGVCAAAGMALQNEALHATVSAQLEDVRASRARVVAAADAERRRVERNLHDGAQQQLLTLALTLQEARRQLPPGEAADATLQRGTDQLRTALADLRSLAQGLHPTILSDEGLGPALRTLADRSAVPVVDLVVPHERLPEAVEAAVYFVVSEGLSNVAKHSYATEVTVRVRADQESVTAEVHDNGIGGADPAGSGLRGLADRVAAVDGVLHVASSPGRGTTLTAQVSR